MDIATMRAYIQSVVEIDSSDISNDNLNRMIGEGYDSVVYSESRWPWYEVSTTFTTVSGTSDYSKATVGASIVGGLRTIAALRTDDAVLAFWHGLEPAFATIIFYFIRVKSESLHYFVPFIFSAILPRCGIS